MCFIERFRIQHGMHIILAEETSHENGRHTANTRIDIRIILSI